MSKSKLVTNSIDRVYTDRSDQDLLEAFAQQPDWNIVLELMRRHSDIVAGHGIRWLKNDEDVKDFAQEMMIQVYQKLQNHQIQSFRAWLTTITRNRLNDMYRRKQVRSHYVAEEANKPDQTTKIDEEQLDINQIKDKLNELAVDEKECLQLLYFQRLPYKDIMAQKQWTFNQLRGYKRRGLKQMRVALGEEFNHYFRTI